MVTTSLSLGQHWEPLLKIKCPVAALRAHLQEGELQAERGEFV